MRQLLTTSLILFLASTSLAIDQGRTRFPTNGILFFDNTLIGLRSVTGLVQVVTVTADGTKTNILSGTVSSDLDSLNTGIGQNASRITGNATDIDRNVGNILVNQFHILAANGAGSAGMIDGRVDFFNNENDVNTGAGANFTFLSAEQAYEFKAVVTRDFTTNLVALYKCDDNAANTTVTDSSGAGNTGISSANTSTFNTAGKIGDGFDLRASTSTRFTIPGFDEAWHEAFATEGRGIAWWMKLNDWTPTAEYFLKSRVNTSPFASVELLNINSSTIFVGIKDDAGNNIALTFTEHTGFTDNTWHHFAYSWEAANDRVIYWIDGVQVGSGVNTSIGTFTSFVPAMQLTFGVLNNDQTAFTQGMDGDVDAIYVWERKLFDEDITALYNLGIGTELLTTETGGDLEIRSNTFTAETEPTEGYAMVLLENTSGWTINTDVTVFLSKDGGTTLDAVPVTFVGDFLPGIGRYTGTNLLTSTGVDMVIVVKSINDAAGRLHGWSPNWK